MRISDWSSDVCSSDLFLDHVRHRRQLRLNRPKRPDFCFIRDFVLPLALALPRALAFVSSLFFSGSWISPAILRSALQTFARLWVWARGLPLLAAALKSSEVHTSELPSLMRLSSAVFCLKTQ